ncbi:MAG: type III polyketide synthase, partial [Jannaschia sp.]
MSVHLHGLSTALPEYRLDQREVAERAAHVFGDRYPQFGRLAKSFATAEVDTRHSVVPIDWFSQPHGWEDRSRAYVAGAKAMFTDAANRALRDAGWQAEQVDVIVTVSSTGIVTPTLDAQVFAEMGFRHDAMRVPVFGLGCAGGVSGLSIARSLATARPG